MSLQCWDDLFHLARTSWLGTDLLKPGPKFIWFGILTKLAGMGILEYTLLDYMFARSRAKLPGSRQTKTIVTKQIKHLITKHAPARNTAGTNTEFRSFFFPKRLGTSFK